MNWKDSSGKYFSEKGMIRENYENGQINQKADMSMARKMDIILNTLNCLINLKNYMSRVKVFTLMVKKMASGLPIMHLTFWNQNVLMSME